MLAAVGECLQEAANDSPARARHRLSTWRREAGERRLAPKWLRVGKAPADACDDGQVLGQLAQGEGAKKSRRTSAGDPSLIAMYDVSGLGRSASAAAPLLASEREASVSAEAAAAVADVAGLRVTLSASLFELAIQDKDSAAAAACATMWS